MNRVVVFFILLGVFPVLFPDACRMWLERVQRWLVAYQEQRNRQWQAQRAAGEETREWGRWIRRGTVTLIKTKTAEERLVLLVQIRAAGEQFLASLSQSAEGKPAHPAVDTVEQQTTALLALLDAEQKRGVRPVDLTPLVLADDPLHEPSNRPVEPVKPSGDELLEEREGERQVRFPAPVLDGGAVKQLRKLLHCLLELLQSLHNSVI